MSGLCSRQPRWLLRPALKSRVLGWTLARTPAQTGQPHCYSPARRCPEPPVPWPPPLRRPRMSGSHPLPQAAAFRATRNKASRFQCPGKAPRRPQTAACEPGKPPPARALRRILRHWAQLQPSHRRSGRPQPSPRRTHALRCSGQNEPCASLSGTEILRCRPTVYRAGNCSRRRREIATLVLRGVLDGPVLKHCLSFGLVGVGHLFFQLCDLAFDSR